MTIDTKSRHITPVGENVFADLGFDKSNADAMLEESHRLISAHPDDRNAKRNRRIPGKQRSRRLRKKLRVGEFQELGFGFEVKFMKHLTFEEEFAFFGAFLSEIVEPRSLAFGGSLHGGFITFRRRGSASEEDRATVGAWLSARPEIDSATIGPLVDVWYIEDGKETN